MAPVLSTAVETTLHPYMFCSAYSNHDVAAANLISTQNVNQPAAYLMDGSLSETTDIQLCVPTLVSSIALYLRTCNQPPEIASNIRNKHYFTYIIIIHYCSHLPWFCKWIWFYSVHSSQPLRFSHTNVEGGGYPGYSM